MLHEQLSSSEFVSWVGDLLVIGLNHHQLAWGMSTRGGEKQEGDEIEDGVQVLGIPSLQGAFMLITCQVLELFE